MADNEKNLPISKEKEKEKRINQRNAARAAAAKRPKRSIVRYFKDAKAEFKKVTWPGPKQVANNTGAVLTAIIFTAAAIYGLDSLFAYILRIAYGLNT